MTKNKSNTSRDVGSYCLDAGMVDYVFRDRFKCCLGRHLHRSL